MIGSAQSLLVSGIGPAGQLRRLGTEVVHDLPGVGQNLQDHPFAHVSFTAKEPLDVEPWGSSAWRPERTDGYSVIVSLQRPRSRGTLTLASPDPAVAPLIDPGYYTDPRDLDLMVTALRRAREMATRTRCTRGGPASLPPAAS